MSKAFKDLTEKSTGTRPGLSQREEELSGIILKRLGVNLPNLNENQLSVEKKIEQFVRTGNFEAEVKIACLNPTFISPDDHTTWLSTDYLACPAFSYFPVPFNDLPSPDINFEDKIYLYCKLKFKSLVTELKKKKKRITFHFHLNDCLASSLKDDKFENRFQVIHCQEIVDGLGLPNVLLTVTNCLAETPESVLLTETRLFGFPKPTVIEYVENGLSCPMSVVSTLYGVRLDNNPQLGSSECYELYDSSWISRHLNFVVTLRWLRVPAYSENILLGVSSDLKTVMNKLSDSCQFVNEDKKIDTDTLEYSLPCPLTPVTFFYLLQSLFDRYNWMEGAIESLIQSTIPSSFQLAWKTVQNWIKGYPVFYLSTLNCYPPEDFSWEGENSNNKPGKYVGRWLIRNDVMIQHKAKTGNIFPAACWSEAQRVDPVLNINDKKGDCSGNISLMLAENHGLDEKKDAVVCDRYSNWEAPLLQ